MRPTSPLASASAYWASAMLKLATYAAWCLLWCSAIISPETTGASAPSS